MTTGAAGAQYGNAQAGIVNLTTRTGGSKFAGRLRRRDGRSVRQDAGHGLQPVRGQPQRPAHPQGADVQPSTSSARATSRSGRARAGRTPRSSSASGVDTTVVEPESQTARPPRRWTSTSIPSIPATAARSQNSSNGSASPTTTASRCNGARLPNAELLGGPGRRQHQLVLRQRLAAAHRRLRSARTRARTSTTSTR